MWCFFFLEGERGLKVCKGDRQGFGGWVRCWIGHSGFLFFFFTFFFFPPFFLFSSFFLIRFLG